ncbi:sigma-70 family RNA polymerase sigma factor [Fodinicurvata sp. EGI_FJ10296]|uniref:sigma-70 family RNA polymerase sigma factor n=1 Tax=Fodinicurvata sp. EGI_FJ10296 TaxID=3231908 RepID=UPI003451F082
MTASDGFDTPEATDTAGRGAKPLDRLIEAVGACQDRQAFQALFAHFAPRIKSYLMQSGSDAGQAEEVAQEVMITVWRRAALFDRRLASASTWIFTIARNKRIDSIRRQRRPQIDFEDPAFVPDPVAPADRIFEEGEDAERVRAAIETLPEEQRALLRMAFFEDKPHSEIASLCSLPLGTVKSRIRLAMTRLRKQLKDE